MTFVTPHSFKNTPKLPWATDLKIKGQSNLTYGELFEYFKPGTSIVSTISWFTICYGEISLTVDQPCNGPLFNSFNIGFSPKEYRDYYVFAPSYMSWLNYEDTLYTKEVLYNTETGPFRTVWKLMWKESGIERFDDYMSMAKARGFLFPVDVIHRIPIEVVMGLLIAVRYPYYRSVHTGWMSKSRSQPLDQVHPFLYAGNIANIEGIRDVMMHVIKRGSGNGYHPFVAEYVFDLIAGTSKSTVGTHCPFRETFNLDLARDWAEVFQNPSYRKITNDRPYWNNTGSTVFNLSEIDGHYQSPVEHYIADLLAKKSKDNSLSSFFGYLPTLEAKSRYGEKYRKRDLGTIFHSVETYRQFEEGLVRMIESIARDKKIGKDGELFGVPIKYYQNEDSSSTIKEAA